MKNRRPLLENILQWEFHFYCPCSKKNGLQITSALKMKVNK